MKISATNGLANTFQRLTDNPIVIKELRGRMRGRRTFIVLTIYLLLIAGLIAVIYNLLVLEASNRSSWDPAFRQNMGKVIFGSVIGFELLLIGFIGPALTAGAITGERERQTFNLLRTTLISSRSLVLGKLISSCAYLLLLVFAALPLEALAFIIGGVGAEEMLVASLMLLVNIFFFCALGILCSSFTKRTLTATITSYTAILISMLLIGLIFYGAIRFSETLYSSGYYNTPYNDLFNMFMWLFCSTNSPLTAIVSEMFLIENHIFMYGLSPFGNGIYLFSPWVLHIPFVTILSAIMIISSISLVNRPER